MFLGHVTLKCGVKVYDLNLGMSEPTTFHAGTKTPEAKLFKRDEKKNLSSLRALMFEIYDVQQAVFWLKCFKLRNINSLDDITFD